jgi:hypothetical protein
MHFFEKETRPEFFHFGQSRLLKGGVVPQLLRLLHLEPLQAAHHEEGHRLERFRAPEFVAAKKSGAEPGVDVMIKNFPRFLTIFREKIGVFLKNQCYDKIFCIIWLCLESKTPFFPPNFSAKIFLKS